MAGVIDRVKGRITGYDERRGVVHIEAPYEDFARMCRREYREVEITMLDSRPLSDRQRKSCYAMLREIAEWSGYEADEIKDMMKFNFLASLVEDMQQFSLSNAPMSLVSAFQTFLARFIIAHDVPTRRPMLEYVDDIDDYVLACLTQKKCCICGKPADLHHVETVGMGRNRDEIIHEGMEVMPLCREHHIEAHTIGRDSFNDKYHIHGIEADKTICRIYGLKRRKSA
ncbi:MAG: hypothetical protein II008_16995 [Oscillospiraceae bacterium]|nr:hypothetical protein [Oscillospiraceae bacterium]